MKHLTEYRDPLLVQQYIKEINRIVTRPWTIMEVCGGQTHCLVKNGILGMLPDKITMVHGPGCPVCVTPVSLIDKAIFLAEQKDLILCSFGDMLRVPGSTRSLIDSKARGADVRILYSPLEAVKLAEENVGKEVVFFAVGFETTAPANALSLIIAKARGVKNYSILCSHVLVPPAMEEVMNDPLTRVNAFLAAGHVSTIMGSREYHALSAKYNIPVVITGFEPVDIVQGILMVVRQLEANEAKVENQYSRMVREQGNQIAQRVIDKVFEVTDRLWRGMQIIPMSGYRVNAFFQEYDANLKFKIDIEETPENPQCIAGDIMKGIKKPFECTNFGIHCTPQLPLGAPMVSSEGACAAYYHYAKDNTVVKTG